MGTSDLGDGRAAMRIPGIVKADDTDPDGWLFAVHGDASRWVPVPRSMVQEVQPTGTVLRGLGAGCKSVLLTLAPPQTTEGQVLGGLLGLHALCLGGPDLEQCYDESTGRSVKC